MSFRAETNKEKVLKRLETLKREFLQKVEKSIKVNSLLLVSYLRKERMRGGTTDTKLRKRSGRLAAGTMALQVEKKMGRVEGGIRFGTAYARVHVGPRGQVSVIKPKAKKYLTVPIEGSPIMTKAGVLKASAAELMTGAAGLPFSETFIRRSRAGNLIIFGKQRVTKGPSIGEKRGGIIPLFVLKKEVRVKSRIHIEDILKRARKLITEDMQKMGVKTNA